MISLRLLFHNADFIGLLARTNRFRVGLGLWIFHKKKVPVKGP
jgi:hypothetical protein